MSRLLFLLLFSFFLFFSLHHDSYAGPYENGVHDVEISDQSEPVRGGAIIESIINNGIRNSRFTNNFAGTQGGAIHVTTLNGGIHNSFFTGNRALPGTSMNNAGGAVYSSTFNGGIFGSTFTNNSAGRGGAVHATLFNDGIHNSYFYGNEATGSGLTNGFGGAIDVISSLNGGIANSTFIGNSAMVRGGAISAPSFAGDLVNSTFSYNSSTSGGAMYVLTMYGNIINSTFTYNSASNNGGALTLDAIDANLKIADSVFESNTSGGVGGAIFSSSMNATTILNSRFINNVAGFGGAIFLSTNLAGASMDLTLSADSGKQLIFSGNRDSTGANSLYFGRFQGGRFGEVDSVINAALTVSGAGNVDLYDPIRVDMTSSTSRGFSFLRDGSLGGDFVWGGRNIISTVGGTADFDFSSGKTMLLSNYTLKAEKDTTLTMRLGSQHNVRFDLPDRDQNLAFFDYRNATGASSLVLDNTTISSSRQLISSSGRYLLVDGYDFASDLQLYDIDEIKARINFINKTGTRFGLELLGDQLWLVYGYDAPRSFHDYRPNVQRALFALDQLVRHTDFGINMTDEEFDRFHNDIDTTPPEVGVTMALINMQNHTSMVRNALRHAYSVAGGRFQAASAFDGLSSVDAYSAYGMGFATPLGRGLKPKRDLMAETFLGHPAEPHMPNVIGNWSPATPEAARMMAELSGMDHLAYAAGSDSLRSGANLWMAYFGNFASADTHSGYMGYDTHTSGMLIGATIGITKDWSVGMYTGFTSTDADFPELRATADTEGFHLGGHVRYEISENFSATLDGAFSEYSIDTERSTAGMSESSGTFSQQIYSVGFELAYELTPWQNARLTPFAGTRYLKSHTDSFTEEGGILSAFVDKSETNSITSVLGIALAHDFTIEDKAVITPSLEFSWTHEYGDRYVKTMDNNFTAQLITDEASIKFNTFSMPRDRDLFQAGTSLQARIYTDKGVSVGLKAAYSMEISENYLGHAVFAGAELSF